MTSSTTKPQSTILVVDDEETNRMLLQEILGEAGYGVITAKNGAYAITQATDAHPDVILLDVMMPEMDGFEVCSRLRARDATAAIPILFLTALSDMDHKLRAFNVGATDYITKPFRAQEVLARVHAHAKLQQTRRQLMVYTKTLEERVAKQTEALLHGDRLMTLGTMSAKLLHELRNPLACVRANLELIRMQGDDALTEHNDEMRGHVKEQIEDAWHATMELSGIASGLQGYAHRTQRGERVAATVQDIVERAAYLVGIGRRPALQLTLRGDEEATLQCQRRPMEQVFVNLFQNASDAARGNPLHLDVEVTVKADIVEVAVADNGPGIAVGTANDIFEAFFTTKKEGEGTGLGMVIVQEILRGHGGAIRFDPDYSEGARFVLSLRRDGQGANEADLPAST